MRTLLFLSLMVAPVMALSYPFGTLPASANVADLNSAYATWKSRRLVAGGCAGSLRVDNGGGTTYSEGMGYGMLMAAYLDPDDVNLGKLYAFYSGNFDSKNLMNWSVPGGSCSNNNANAATDGDLDVALALLQANKRWPGNGWNTKATTLLNNIYANMIDACQTIKNGDVWGGCAQGGNQAYNPSYFRTGYLKSFDCYEGGSRWNTVRTNSYSKLSTAYASYALPPDWLQASGNYGQGQYGYDACRTPWALGMDYLWFGNGTAQNWGIKTTDVFRVKAGGTPAAAAADIGDGYDYATGNKTSGNHEDEFIGGIAVGAMASAYPAFLDACYIELKNKDNNSYFADSLKVIYLMALTGVFTEPACAAAGSSTFTPPSTPSSTRSSTSTRTPSFTATRTSSPSASPSGTATLTSSTTSSPSLTPSFTLTSSMTASRTATPTPTSSATTSASVTTTRTGTSTSTPSFSMSSSSTSTRTETSTRTPSQTSSATSSGTQTSTSSFTVTVSMTPTSTLTFTPSLSATGSFSATETTVGTATFSPTLTPTPSQTPTVTVTASSSPAGSSPTVTATSTPSGIASVNTASPETGEIIARVLSYPNPGVPTHFAVQIGRHVDTIEIKLYTKAMVCAGRVKSGAAGPGWAMIPVPADFARTAASGTYYFVATAEYRGETTRKNGLGQMVIQK